VIEHRIDKNDLIVDMTLSEIVQTMQPLSIKLNARSFWGPSHMNHNFRNTPSVLALSLSDKAENYGRYAITHLPTGKERKPRSVGMEVPWHFHVLMTAHCPIPPQLIEDSWRKLVGPGKSRDGRRTPGGDSVNVQSFNDEKRGAEYCLKLINDCNGDWNFRWLELFNPNIPPSDSMNHRKLRNQARSAKQASMSKQPSD
jgi:hypothetical protein